MTLHERQILVGAVGERVADDDRLVARLDFPLVVEVAVGALDPGRLRRGKLRLDAERFAAQRQFQGRLGQPCEPIGDLVLALRRASRPAGRSGPAASLSV